MFTSENTRFISDIHLNLRQPEITQQFLAYLEQLNLNSQIQNLFILGDLFEYWIGDDDRNSDFHRLIICALFNLKNIKKYFIKGNRDFLIGDAFAIDANMIILPDLYIIEFNQQKTLLSHGDIFCTDDVEYQKFRQMVRSEAWQIQFLNKPLQERQMIAEQLRLDSVIAKNNKTSYEMDINISTLNEFMQKFQAQHIIHGHTHRPAIHQHDFYTREVLKSW